jgi:hypothetical protein
MQASAALAVERSSAQLVSERKSIPSCKFGRPNLSDERQVGKMVVGVLTPICVEKFQHQANAPARLAEFNKVSTSWDRETFIEKGG